jgi:hypothetical protein
MGDVTSDLIQKTLRNNLSWKSVDCEVRYVTHQLRVAHSNGNNVFVMMDRYVETDRAERRLYQAYLEDGKETRPFIALSDGRRFANLNPEAQAPDGLRKSVNIIRSFFFEAKIGYVERPVPLCYQYVGMTPLHEALPNATHVGAGSVIGRDCETYLFAKVPGRLVQDLSYWLDRATSLPLRVEAHRAETTAAGRPNWVWEATELAEADGYPYVRKSHYTSYTLDASGAATTDEKMTIDYDVTQMAFNRPHEASEFWYTPEPGMQVVDAVGGSIYDVPGGPPPSPIAATAVGTPIQAPETPPTSSIVPAVSIGLGLAVLGAGIALWVRQRGA